MKEYMNASQPNNIKVSIFAAELIKLKLNVHEWHKIFLKRKSFEGFQDLEFLNEFRLFSVWI